MRTARTVITIAPESSASSFMFSTSKRVLQERGARLYCSNIGQRGRPYAVSLSSDLPKVHKIQKKISKNERRPMVESFVNKYRELNAGKFPSVSRIKKEVGGSYYVVREIFQEIEFNSRISPMDKEVHVFSAKAIPAENGSSPRVQEASTGKNMRHSGIQTGSETVAVSDASAKNVEGLKDDAFFSHIKETVTIQTKIDPKLQSDSSMEFVEDVNGNGSRNGHLEANIALDIYPSVEKTLNEYVTSKEKVGHLDSFAVESNLHAANGKKISHPSATEGSKRDQTAKEIDDVKIEESPYEDIQNVLDSEQTEKDHQWPPGLDKIEDANRGEPVNKVQNARWEGPEYLQNFDGPKHSELNESSGPDNIASETMQTQEHRTDEEPRKKSSILGNLKSLADGIVSFWRNL